MRGKALILILIFIFTPFANIQQNNLELNEVYNAPPEDSSWVLENTSSASTFEVFENELIFNGNNFAILNETGFHSLDNAPTGSDPSVGCQVLDFYLNGSWFRLKGNNMHIYDDGSWNVVSSNHVPHVDNIHCYHQFIRFDYDNSEFIIASYSAADGPDYDQNNCRYSTFFTRFDSSGSIISNTEYTDVFGQMKTTVNGRCQVDTSQFPTYSNRNIILKSNQSNVYGFHGGLGTDDDRWTYRLFYESNNTEALDIPSYACGNCDYREGVNYFSNSSGELNTLGSSKVSICND